MRAAPACLLVLVLVLALAAPASAADPLRFFRSPSANIDCLVTNDYARCDIRARSFTAPRRPARCDLEWGSSLSVAKASRRGGFACVGDTVRDPKATR
ncbi:MAG: hypothetical protein QOG42_24, partial [Solirubrobacteraceae bacterium]|nr:hypothetical protein [Solirubrobacteraceae bacterium]